MIKKVTVSSIALLFHFLAFSQNTQNYQSELIESFQKDSLHYNFIEHISVVDTTITKDEIGSIENKLKGIIKSLPKKEEKSKKEIKRIRKIYDVIHDELFVKYDEDALFTSIFDDGKYNCVSATAIYAYIFDIIKVPYVVKEYPGHVFLIAYPNKLKIHLETTTPGDYGFSSPKDSEVESIVNDMIKMKLITEEEVKAKGVSKTYMDYFYGDEFVDKKALIGMEYYNLALKYYREEKYDIALQNIEKSLVYFPYPSSKYLKNTLVFLNLLKMKFDKIDQVDMFITSFSNLEYDKDYNTNDIDYYLYKITDNNEVEQIETILEKFENFQNKEVKQHIKKYFYRYLAIKYIEDELLDEAIIYCKKLLELENDNRKAKDIIKYAVGKKIGLLPISEDTLNEIETYIEEYPSLLTDNVRIDSFRVHVLVKLIQDNFTSKNLIQGEKYMKQLNSLLDLHKSKILVNREYIAYAFFFSGKYYYQHNDFQKAFEKLNRGLEFSSKNPEIIKYLKWTKEEMN